MAQTPLNERLFQGTTSSRREVHFSGNFEFAYYRGPNKMRRKPASSVKERVSEEVLVEFEAENLRCHRPHDTWGGSTLSELPWFYNNDNQLTLTRSYQTVWSVCLGLTLKK